MIKKFLGLSFGILLTISIILSIILSITFFNMLIYKLLGVKYSNVSSLFYFILTIKILQLPLKILFVKLSKKIVNTSKSKFIILYGFIYSFILYFIFYIVDILIFNISITNNIIIILVIISLLINIIKIFLNNNSHNKLKI